MSDLLAVSGARIFDGSNWHDDAALLVEFGFVSGIVAHSEIPHNAHQIALDGGMIVPGFIDLQVNGGGGVLFNNAPDVEGLRTICAAHARFGTVGLLPTLITDTPEITRAAIRAGIEAHRQRVPGFLGLHLEGPHLSVERKGTHDPTLIRPMQDEDIACLLEAAEALPLLLCTVATEAVTTAQIAQMTEAGIVVSIGHSDGTYATTRAAFDAGATMVTHLFNAMSQLGNREPGMVGAVLDTPGVSAGIIADGIHVHPAAIGAALRAKRGPGHIFLVTDAMSQTGTDLTTITLNNRTITRSAGALRLPDGTLAGADLDMIDAVNFMIDAIGLPIDDALRMASLYPAKAMGSADIHGHLCAGAAASFVHLDESRSVQATWVNGTKAWSI